LKSSSSLTRTICNYFPRNAQFQSLISSTSSQEVIPGRHFAIISWQHLLLNSFSGHSLFILLLILFNQLRTLILLQEYHPLPPQKKQKSNKSPAGKIDELDDLGSLSLFYYQYKFYLLPFIIFFYSFLMPPNTIVNSSHTHTNRSISSLLNLSACEDHKKNLGFFFWNTFYDNKIKKSTQIENVQLF